MNPWWKLLVGRFLLDGCEPALQQIFFAIHYHLKFQVFLESDCCMPTSMHRVVSTRQFGDKNWWMQD
jgi:hypothetical protein